MKGAIVGCLEKVDKLLSRFLSGIRLCDPLEGCVYAEFFPEFSFCRFSVVLTCVDMARSTGIPFERADIFPAGAFLQKNFSCSIPDQDVDGAVT